MRALLSGPPFVLPAPLDAAARRWSRVPPRVRALMVLVVVLGLLLATEVRVQHAEARWGGAPVTAWVATSDVGVGEVPELRRVRLPPGALPAQPVQRVSDVGPLTLALPEGAVLTQRHVSPVGPAVGLPPGSRLVPVPVDDGWAVAAGSRVDVWMAEADGSTSLVAAARPVLEVRGGDGSGGLTALVAVEAGDVTALARGLGDGTVLLSHTP